MTISSPRFRRRPLAAALALAAVLAVPTAAHAARRPAPRPRTCDVAPLAGTLGTTTVTSLKVTGVRCDAGVRVVRAFTACRLANGPSGRCVRLVNGYACGELRSNGPTSFSATATCRKDRKSVVHKYTQTL